MKVAGALVAALLLLKGAPVQARCKAVPGLTRMLADKALFVVLGELHGTEQAPDLIANMACALSQEGAPVLVALELAARDDPALQAAWSGPHAGFAARITAAVREFGAGRGGGPASAALLQALDRLHALKSAGAPIQVVAFASFRDGAQQRRFGSLRGQNANEAAQADNIRAAAKSRSYRRVLVLVGNTHARKRSLTLGGIEVQPMAMRLAPAADVLALNMAYTDGAAFNCVLKPEARPSHDTPITVADLDCGEHLVSGNVSPGGPLGVGVGPPPGGKTENWSAYDGYFAVGAISASGPATRAE